MAPGPTRAAAQGSQILSAFGYGEITISVQIPQKRLKNSPLPKLSNRPKSSWLAKEMLCYVMFIHLVLITSLVLLVAPDIPRSPLPANPQQLKMVQIFRPTPDARESHALKPQCLSFLLLLTAYMPFLVLAIITPESQLWFHTVPQMVEIDQTWPTPSPSHPSPCIRRRWPSAPGPPRHRPPRAAAAAAPPASRRPRRARIAPGVEATPRWSAGLPQRGTVTGAEVGRLGRLGGEEWFFWSFWQVQKTIQCWAVEDSLLSRAWQ